MTYPDPKAVEEDHRLQADPELDVSASPATMVQKVFTAIASIAIIVLVLYGLAHQRYETVQTASAPATQTTGSSPPAGAQEPSQQQAGQAPGAGQQGQPQQGNSEGGDQNHPQGQAQTGQGPGNATPRETTGAAPRPPAGAPESAKSPSGTQK